MLRNGVYKLNEFIRDSGSEKETFSEVSVQTNRFWFELEPLTVRTGALCVGLGLRRPTV